MTPGLRDCLRECLQVTAESDPREMEPEELAYLDRLDDQIADLLDALIDMGECRPQMQAVLARAMGRPS